MKIKYIQTKDSRGLHINDFISKNYPHFINEPEPDIIFVSGGDGAMLHAMQEHHHHNKPFLGHAIGTLNFSMNRINNLEEFFPKLISGKQKLYLLDLNAIRVWYIDKSGIKKEVGQAINDLVIGTHIMGYHHLSISSVDKSFNNLEFKGAGICIATFFGSTGYNFNLGGPILPLDSDLWSIKGVICNRYIEDIIKVQSMTINNLSENSLVNIFIDGIDKEQLLGFEEKILFERGKMMQLAFLDKNEFMQKRVEIASRYRH